MLRKKDHPSNLVIYGLPKSTQYFQNTVQKGGTLASNKRRAFITLPYLLQHSLMLHRDVYHFE